MSSKSSILDVIIGDTMPCRYIVPVTGALGAFSEFGTSIADLIAVTGGTAPNGRVNFAFVGYDMRGRMKFVADRNIQNSISYDVLNKHGITSGEGLEVDLGLGAKYRCTIRLLTGNNSTNTDNEWDKIVCESTLNGTISPGDNFFWNWTAITSWTSTTGSVPANKITRGLTLVGASNSPTGIVTTTEGTTTGFRPVLIIEDMQKLRYLLQDGDNYKSINLDHLVTVGNIYDTDTEKATSFESAPVDIRQFVPLLSELDSIDRKFKVLKRLV